MRSVRHLELFSGIGGFRRAFDVLSDNIDYLSECIGFSEIDKSASAVYKNYFDVNNELEIGDIVEFTESVENIRRLKGFDILTGGFPCQAFSMMGYQKGFSDERGNLFFNITKILEEKRPRFILLENVRNLIKHDGGNTFSVIKGKLEDLGYHVYYDIFNTANFELAQTRNRVYIFGSLTKMSDGFEFTQERIMSVFSRAPKIGLLCQKNVMDVLEKKVDAKYYLSEKIKPTILSNGTGKFRSNSEINQIIARPLTATMVKMHRACQDNYYSDEFINSPSLDEYLKASYTKEEQLKQHIRKLTPEEAFALQGFPKEMALRARVINISDHQLYKQAGNAASVNVIYAILYYLFKKESVMDL